MLDKKILACGAVAAGVGALVLRRTAAPRLRQRDAPLLRPTPPSSSGPRPCLSCGSLLSCCVGRTALLLSGGGAFGVKHIGVVMALHKESLMPRILSGTSAGSIVAAYCGTKTDEELQEMLLEDPII